MTNTSVTFSNLTDGEVLARVHDAVRVERVATAHLIALLIELDVRKLYLAEGCSSLFTYCTQVLHLSEHARGRCPETGCLEYHHVTPFASGGKTMASNLELRCRAHN
jgi:hypothetical protein